MSKKRVLVRFGEKQVRVRNALEDVSGNEGYVDADLLPGLFKSSAGDAGKPGVNEGIKAFGNEGVEGRKTGGPAGVGREPPVVYTSQRVADETGYSPQTISLYLKGGRIGSSALLRLGRQDFRVVCGEDARRFIGEKREGASLIEGGGMRGEKDFARTVGLNQPTVSKIADELGVDFQKVGQGKYYGPEARRRLLRYHWFNREMRGNWSSPEDVADRMGVSVRTVFNWLERDFELDGDSGRLVPEYMPAVRLEKDAGGDFPKGYRYLFPKSLVDDDNVIGEWKTRFPVEHRRKRLPKDRRSWSFISDVAEDLGVNKVTMATYVKERGLGEKHGKERIVDEMGQLRLWHHFTGSRLVERLCVSIGDFGELMGVSRETPRDWIARYAERDERGPSRLFGIDLFRFEGRVYIPRRSQKAGYDLEDEQSRERLRERITAGVSGERARRKDEDVKSKANNSRIMSLMYLSRHKPGVIADAVGSGSDRNTEIAESLFKLILGRTPLSEEQSRADDLVSALSKLRESAGDAGRDDFLKAMSKPPVEDVVGEVVNDCRLINDAPNPRMAALHLERIRRKWLSQIP